MSKSTIKKLKSNKLYFKISHIVVIKNQTIRNIEQFASIIKLETNLFCYL